MAFGDDDRAQLNEINRVMEGLRLTLVTDSPTAPYLEAGRRLGSAILTVAGPAYAQKIAQAVVAALPPGGAPVDLDVLADLIVAKMGGKLSV